MELALGFEPITLSIAYQLFRACGHRDVPLRPDAEDPLLQVLVMRTRRAADLPPLLRQVRGVGPADQNLGKEAGKVCGWRHSRAPWIGSLVGYERATPAVLTFLWDTKVGEFVSLAALGGGAGVEEEAEQALEEGEEGRLAPP